MKEELPLLTFEIPFIGGLTETIKAETELKAFVLAKLNRRIKGMHSIKNPFRKIKEI